MSAEDSSFTKAQQKRFEKAFKERIAAMEKPEAIGELSLHILNVIDASVEEWEKVELENASPAEKLKSAATALMRREFDMAPAPKGKDWTAGDDVFWHAIYSDVYSGLDPDGRILDTTTRQSYIESGVAFERELLKNQRLVSVSKNALQ